MAIFTLYSFDLQPKFNNGRARAKEHASCHTVQGGIIIAFVTEFFSTYPYSLISLIAA